MELRVFDETVEPLGLIDEMASLLWHMHTHINMQIMN